MRNPSFAETTKNALDICNYSSMSNEEIADKVFEELKPQYKELYLIKEGISQHFVTSKDKLEQLDRQLNLKKKDLQKKVSSIEEALKQLNQHL
ncbi:hypothetical protein BN2127_JRS1_00327 [Bacillus cereus]|nr:hypothetical protein BN2127_JRS1_00327 [Bacillus cereus]